jgi:PAS domain S-box-containing protein
MNVEKVQFAPETFDHWPSMVWILDPGGQPTYLNNLAQAFTGDGDLASHGHQWLDRVFPDDRATFESALRQGLEHGQDFTVEYRRLAADGEYHHLVERGSLLLTPDGSFCGIFCLVSDLTANLFSEPASGAVQVELLSQITHDVVWDWDYRTNIVTANATFIETLGEPPPGREEASNWWKERAHPDDIDRVAQLFNDAVQSGKSNISYEYRIRDSQGAWLTLDSRMRLIRDASGQLIRMLVVSRDISKRREAEDAQARYLRIIEATTDFVGMATTDGRLFYVNAAGRKMLGIGANEDLDFHLSQTHPAWANEIIQNEAIPTAVREGYWRGENAMLHRDGHEFPVSQVLVSHRQADGTVEFLSTIIQDLSNRKREETERIEWANRYDAAIRASGQILFDWNSANNEMAYAGDIEQMFGYTRAEMAGGLDRFRQLIHPDDLARFNERVQQITATRDPFHLHFRIHHKRGRPIHLEARGYFFLDRQGQIGRMVGFFADVTAGKVAEEAIAQAHDSVEQRVGDRTADLAQASALLEDRARRQEAIAQLGHRALTGASLRTLMDEAMPVIRKILRVDRCALLDLTHDGKELVVRAHAGWPDSAVDNRIPVGLGSQSGYTLLRREPVIMEDSATEKRFSISSAVLEAGLKSGLSIPVMGPEGLLGVLATFTVSLRRFVQEDIYFLQSVANLLTAAIQRERAEESIRQAREQAELASRAKSEFLSRVSHELRTPLNAILGFTQLLELEEIAPSQAESVQHISEAGRHLLSLINEVLDVARMDAGRFALTPEPVEVHNFLTEALDRTRNLARRHNVALIFDSSDTSNPPLEVLADRLRLHQVMFNLISNAVKYNRSGGQVTVSYRAEGPNVRIMVADTGRGIEPDKLARLFLPFERLGAESSDIEGSGIGLALSRGIVTALQGELNVESRVGEGSTFWVTLPRPEDTVPAAEVGPAAEPAKPVVHAQHTVLYIEDQDLNLRLVERILSAHPQYRLLTAQEGGIGLRLAHEQLPDLILLDLNLPDMSGDEVLHRLKSDPAVRHIPVVMVSADVMGERIQHLLRLGATGYLTKPYKLDQFLKVIQDSLEKKAG